MFVGFTHSFSFLLFSEKKANRSHAKPIPLSASVSERPRYHHRHCHYHLSFSVSLSSSSLSLYRHRRPELWDTNIAYNTTWILITRLHAKKNVTFNEAAPRRGRGRRVSDAERRDKFSFFFFLSDYRLLRMWSRARAWSTLTISTMILITTTRNTN